MPISSPTCSCPRDSKPVILSRINNNLTAILFMISAGQFKGNTVNFSSCLCSELQILQILNNNLVAGFNWLAAAGGAVVDPGITSWATLADVPTIGVSAGALKIWVDSTNGILKATQLIAGTAATDTASGLQRPNDYGPSNEKYWANVLA